MALLTNDHSSVASAPALRLRLVPTHAHRTILDGCWWPSSADPAAELPGLVVALERVYGPVTRVLLSAAGWSRRPHHVEVDGRIVTLGYFSDQPATMLTANCGADSVALQVVPAATASEEN
jgi:Family of unknown function (DUF5994)